MDRILDITELFPILHPKKSSQMTGSWLYGLFESLRKLVNFGYKDVNYGLEMLHLVENLPPGQTELYHLDFSIVMNRIFLEVYKEPQ